MLPDPTRLCSGNTYIPYEYQRKALTPEQAQNYRTINVKYARYFNGELTDIVTDRFFFNRMHFESCLHHWNSLAASMGRTPSPFDGKFYKWEYKEVA
jgi:hypothetical protein